MNLTQEEIKIILDAFDYIEGKGDSKLTSKEETLRTRLLKGKD